MYLHKLTWIIGGNIGRKHRNSNFQMSEQLRWKFGPAKNSLSLNFLIESASQLKKKKAIWLEILNLCRIFIYSCRDTHTHAQPFFLKEFLKYIYYISE